MFDKPSANRSEVLDEELGFHSTYWTFLLFMNIYNYFQSIIENDKLTSVYENKRHEMKHAVVYWCMQKYFYCWQDFSYKSVRINELLKRTRKVQWIVRQSNHLRLTMGFWCSSDILFRTENKIISSYFIVHIIYFKKS